MCRQSLFYNFQANYIFENGDEDTNITSYGVLDITVSVNDKKTISDELNISNSAYSCIKKTGLRSGIL